MQKMITVLLVNPPHKNRLVFPSINDKVAFSMHNFAPPLGLLYIKSYLEQEENVRVEFFNFQTPQAPSLETFAEYLKQCAPDIIGITALTPFWYGVCQVTGLIKKTLPAAFIVGGGPHMWEYPEESLKAGGFNLIVQGRGELPFRQIIQHFISDQDFGDIPGVICIQNGQIIKNPPAPVDPQGLDELPFPDRSVLDIGQHHFSVNRHNPAALMIASRGCPYNCAFCLNKEKYFTPRNPAAVVAEIRECLEMGYKSIQFCDDVFSFSRDHTVALCREMRGQGINIPWACQTRVDCVDAELLYLMVTAGCERIQFGIESMNQRYLDRINKSLTPQQTEAVFAMCRQAGVQTVANVIIGFPGETACEANETLRFTASLEPDYIFCNPLIPIPGTRIFTEAAEDPDFDDEWIKEFIRHPRPDEKIRLWTTAMGEAEISRIVKRFYLRYYFAPHRIWRHFRKVTGPRDLIEKAKTAAALAFAKS